MAVPRAFSTLTALAFMAPSIAPIKTPSHSMDSAVAKRLGDSEMNSRPGASI